MTEIYFCRLGRIQIWQILSKSAKVTLLCVNILSLLKAHLHHGVILSLCLQRGTTRCQANSIRFPKLPRYSHICRIALAPSSQLECRTVC